MSLDSISKNDFLFFKNDILKDLKSLQTTMENKIAQVNQGLLYKINEHDSVISKLTENINEVLSKYASSRHDNQRIEELLSMRLTINDALADCKTQINLVNRSLNSAISKYDTIIIDNLNLPGVVGYSCKYKNFKEFFDFIYKELKANSVFKTQQLEIMKRFKQDFMNFEKKEEKDIIDSIDKSNKYCDDIFRKYEKIIEEKFNATQEFVEITRLENSKNAAKLIEKTEELETYYDKLKEIKKEIFEDFEKELEKFKNQVDTNNKIFSKNKNDLQLLKQRFTELSQFIKDIRFQRNIKYERYEKMAKKIDFNRNQKFQDDYDMNLYNEIAKDVLAYLKGGNEEEKIEPKVDRSNRRTSSLMINQNNKDLIKKSLLKNLRNSTKPNSNLIDKIDFKPIPMRKNRRNSMIIQKPNLMGKKMRLFEPPKTIIKEENSFKKKKNNSIKKDINLKSNNEQKEKEIISFSKSDEEESSSSSSSSTSSIYSSRTYSTKKTKTKEEKKSQKESKKHLEFKSINTPSKNQEVKPKNNKKLNKTEMKIKSLKDEYGYKARLMSVDYMAVDKFKNQKGMTLFNLNDNRNTYIQKLVKPSMNKKLKLKGKNKTNFISNHNFYYKTDNNFNNYANDSTLNYNVYNSVKKNPFYPIMLPNLEKKNPKKILLYQSQTNNISLNLNMNKKKINTISHIDFQIKGVKNNDDNRKNNNISIHEIVNIKLNEKKEKIIKKRYEKDELKIQIGDIFNMEGIINKENIIKEYKPIIKFKKENLKEIKKVENMKNNDNSSEISSVLEREFEKEQTKMNINIIKEKINKMNNDNEALNSKINILEDKYTPVLGQMNELVQILSLIYNTIKKNEKQTLTIIHNTTNNINTNSNPIISNLKQKSNIKDIIKDSNNNYNSNKKVMKFTSTSIKHNSTRNNDNNKKVINEEDNNIENENFEQFAKDELNLLLRKIEPFLIKKFSKKKKNE